MKPHLLSIYSVGNIVVFMGVDFLALTSKEKNDLCSFTGES